MCLHRHEFLGDIACLWRRWSHPRVLALLPGMPAAGCRILVDHHLVSEGE